MPKIVLAIDSSIFNTYQLCHRRAYFGFVHKIEPMTKEVYFDRGTLIHQMLKYHYRLLRHNTRNPMPDGKIKTFSYRDIIRIVCDKAERFSLHLDAQPEEIIRTIETYQEYADYYEGENWNPIMVEEPFSKVLYDDDDVTILWEGIVDLLIQHGIVDTKSSERRGEPSSLSYQFQGYCWALERNTLIVNKVGFQKTLKAKDKFERYTKSYPQEILDEWKNEVIEVVLSELLPDVIEADEETRKGEILTCKMYRKANKTSCDKFGQCRYFDICTTVPELRMWKIENKYKVGIPWEPAKSLSR